MEYYDTMVFNVKDTSYLKLGEGLYLKQFVCIEKKNVLLDN